MAGITIKQGEGKWINFTITDALTGAVVPGLDTATYKFGIKLKDKDTAYLIEYLDGSFDKTNFAIGKIRVKLQADDTALLAAKMHVGELKIDFGSGEIDKSSTIEIDVRRAVIHD